MKLLNEGVPLYVQVAGILRKRIEDAEYEIGASLPSEPNLAKEFGISRMTVREAIGLLKKEGIVVGRHGTGNIVKSRGMIDGKYGRITGSIEDLLSYAEETEYKIIENKAVAPPPDVQEALKLSATEMAVEISGRRYSGENLLSVSFIYVPYSIGIYLLDLSVTTKPVFRLIEENCNISIMDVEQRITAIMPEENIGSLLALAKGDPVLAIRRTYFLADEKPVEFVKAYHKADTFEYAIRLKRKWNER